MKEDEIKDLEVTDFGFLQDPRLPKPMLVIKKPPLLRARRIMENRDVLISGNVVRWRAGDYLVEDEGGMFRIVSPEKFVEMYDVLRTFEREAGPGLLGGDPSNPVEKPETSPPTLLSDWPIP